MLSRISPMSLILILLIVVVLFGTRRLRNMGNDVGSAVKGFRKGMSEADDTVDESAQKAKETKVEDTKNS